MLSVLLPQLALLAATSTGGAGEVRIDAAALVRELGSREELARLPAPEWTLQSSRSVLRWEEHAGRREAVLADVTGPGAFVRLACAAPRGQLRLYLGEASEPAFEAELSALVGPQASWPPLRTSALDQLRMPLPFARRARLTLAGVEQPDVLVSWRCYPEGCDVSDFRAPAPAELTALRKSWDEKARGPDGQLSYTFSLSQKVPAGEFLGTDPKLCAGPRAVSTLVLHVDGPDRELALRTLVLHLTFDGEETVSCPLAMLVHAGELDPRTQGLWTSDLVLRWIMPYRTSFDLFVENLGPSSTHVSGSVYTRAWTWDERSLHFGARWIGARGASELSIEGQGLLLGIVSASIPARFTQLEAALDGARVPLCDALALLERAPFRTSLAFAQPARDEPWPQRVALVYLRPGAVLRGREAQPGDLVSLTTDR